TSVTVQLSLLGVGVSVEEPHLLPEAHLSGGPDLSTTSMVTTASGRRVANPLDQLRTLASLDDGALLDQTGSGCRAARDTTRLTTVSNEVNTCASSAEC